MIIPKSISGYLKGTIKFLLEASYKPFHLEFPEYMDENMKSFFECDSFFYDNPEIAEKCSFISEYEHKVVGMCCWDPRNFPVAIIGHNCILPEFRRLGLGKEQMRVALRILKEKGFKMVRVSTSLMEFFIPAQKMYTGVGFEETNPDVNLQQPEGMHNHIYYELDL